MIRFGRHSGLLPLFTLLALFGSGPALAGDPPPLTTARVLLESGRAQEALEKLLPFETSESGDPEFDLLLGWAWLDTDRKDRAAFALERVLMVEKENARAHLLTARLLAKRNDRAQARTHLDQANTLALSPSLQREVAKLRLELDEAEREANKRAERASRRGTRFAGNLQASLGYDTNAASGPAMDMILIPSVSSSPVSLGTSSKANDWVNTLSGTGLFQTPVGEHTYLTGGANLSQGLQYRRADLQETYTTGMLGVAHQIGSETISLTGLSQAYWLDETLTRTYWGAMSTWQHPLTQNSYLSSYLQYLNYTYPGSASYNTERFAIGTSHHLEAPDASWNGHYGAYIGHEAAKKTASLSSAHDLWGFNLGGKYPLADKVSLNGSASFEKRLYESVDPYYFQPRKDLQSTINTTVDWEFSRDWHLVPGVYFVDNDSNLMLFKYNRTLTTLTLRWDIDP
ncbi:MAG: DUF560 domain-containing protein [Magnetococcales bacterium]|nr:DUF560 domain-containing protein [Magnetococcales bacterium]